MAALVAYLEAHPLWVTFWLSLVVVAASRLGSRTIEVNMVVRHRQSPERKDEI